MPQLPNLSQLSHAEKDALILALFARLEALNGAVAALEAKLGRTAEDPGQFQPAAIEGAEAQPGGESRDVVARARAVWAARAAVVRWPAIPMRR